nr:hypothetical protein [Tanacetum cinerariifolium]
MDDDKEFSFGLDFLMYNEVTETAINDVMHTASAEGLSNSRDSEILSEQCHNMEEKEEDGNIDVAINENGGIQENAEEVEKAASGTQTNLTDNGHLCSVQEMEEIVEDVTEKAVASTSPEGDVEISTIEDLNKHCNGMEEMEQQLVSQKELIMALRNRVVSLEKTEEKALLFLQNVSSQRYIYRVKKPFYVKKRRLREEFLSTKAPKVDLRKRSEILADGESSSRVIIDDDHEQEEEHSVVNDGILGFAKPFNDEIIFDNISRAFIESAIEEVVRAAPSSLPDNEFAI